MLQFNIDKSNEFEFQMDVAGDSYALLTPKVEFKIVSEGLSLSFPAHKSGDKYEVKVKPLTGLIKPGTYACEVCVYLGDRYFVPLAETVDIQPDAKPIISNFKINNKETEAPPVRIEAFVQKNVPQTIIEEKPIAAPVKLAPIVPSTVLAEKFKSKIHKRSK